MRYINKITTGPGDHPPDGGTNADVVVSGDDHTVFIRAYALFTLFAGISFSSICWYQPFLVQMLMMPVAAISGLFVYFFIRSRHH